MIEGVWLPIITPFYNGEVDYNSFKSLIEFYLEKNISGIIPLGTTGESPTIEEDEYMKIVETAIETVNKKIPVYVGLGGNNTKKVIMQLKKIEHLGIEGILSVAPYYSRPSQDGIYFHFKQISENTDKNILIYNIPYRSAINIENKTLFKLAEFKNIVGVKDSCGNIKQTTELILNKPEDFSVLTGEDLFFYHSLVLGGNGGILASAHLETEKYIQIYNCVKQNDHQAALKVWKEVSKHIPDLFIEPNPAPVKYVLKTKDLIRSAEVRLPLSSVSIKLKEKLMKW
jgi:4-hydroxy-tetrahydrodipicolinate synthase